VALSPNASVRRIDALGSVTAEDVTLAISLNHQAGGQVL
jgi:hypothetical protein